MKKRAFIKNLGAIGLLPFSDSFFNSSAYASTNLPNQSNLSEKEKWQLIRSQYDLHPDFINLESGYYNIIPKPTLVKQIEHLKRVNLEGSYYMREHRFKDKDRITAALAEFVGCAAENLVVTRNTTESLDLVISGFPWKKGDEAIYAVQDYGAMQVMFEQVEKRHGIGLRKVSVPNHPENDEEIVRLYENEITAQTKLIMISHMINITGHILPVKKICQMAHRYGVQVLVDGAHCIGHFEFNIEDFDCDYYGSSLHKWLATPLGAGLLYVKSKHIPNIWPLLADHEKDPTKIRRLSHTGTHPVATDLTIIDAISYLNWIGLEQKENRLRYLKTYWQEALKDTPNIIINTSFDPWRSCGIGNVGLKNMKPAILAKRLFEEFNVFTVAIDYANVKGCRISPNVFTTKDELDTFIDAMKKLSTS